MAGESIMSNKDKEDMNGLGTPDNIVDQGDLFGNPINTPDGKPIDEVPKQKEVKEVASLTTQFNPKKRPFHHII